MKLHLFSRFSLWLHGRQQYLSIRRNYIYGANPVRDDGSYTAARLAIFVVYERRELIRLGSGQIRSN